MKRYKTDCFAFGHDKIGRAKCEALTKLDCEGCNFYKVAKEYLDDKYKHLLEPIGRCNNGKKQSLL